LCTPNPPSLSARTHWMTGLVPNVSFALVVEYMAQQILPLAQQKCEAQEAELALFGTGVACVVASKCSNCQESRAAFSCNCKVWTCRCQTCYDMRSSYRAIQNATSLNRTWRYKLPLHDHEISTANCTRRVCGALPAIAKVSKGCLEIFRVYRQSVALVHKCSQSLYMAHELALYGTSVGCVDKICSVCVMPMGECACKAWTCRCGECWELRHIYKEIAGTDKDVMFYRTIACL